MIACEGPWLDSWLIVLYAFGVQVSSVKKCRGPMSQVCATMQGKDVRQICAPGYSASSGTTTWTLQVCKLMSVWALFAGFEQRSYAFSGVEEGVAVEA